MSPDRTLVWLVCLATLDLAGHVGPCGRAAQAAETVPDSDEVRAELLFWESVKDSRNPEELRAYLVAYPRGRFVRLAEIRLGSDTDPARGDKGADATPIPADARPVPDGQGSQASIPPSQGGPPGVGEPAPGAAPQKPPGMPAGVKPGEAFRDCDTCPQLVVIPAGRFRMGANAQGATEAPVHEVVIPRDFAMGRFEVLTEEWDSCVREGGCLPSPQTLSDAQLPIANLSWDDTSAYVKWLSAKTGKTYRLPTESEWEYAARAGTSTRYVWGDDKGDALANCADCGSRWGGKQPSPVGTFQANPFGLYDLHGNVWEWTQDCWNPSYVGAPSDGGPWLRGDCLSPVLRGGSWALDHDSMPASRRTHYDRDVRYYLNGFRVVRELAAPTDADAPFEAAVGNAAGKVFAGAPKAKPGGRPWSVAFDPVVDGLAGIESAASRAMVTRLIDLAGASHPQLRLKGLSGSDPDYRYVLIGTFTGVNKERKSSGTREAFRICLALLDPQSGKVVANAREFAEPASVDIAPTAFHRDSPAWTPDSAIAAYIKSCQASKIGEPFDPQYAELIPVAAIINDAIAAYEAADYKTSLRLFQRAAKTRGGNQLRTYNGLYLSNIRLGDRRQATEAFTKLVELGLNNRRLGIKFPFSPGESNFAVNQPDSAQTDLWLGQIARSAMQRRSCLMIQGHSPRGDSGALGANLALRRAEYVKRRLEAEAPGLRLRMSTQDRGSQDNLIGSGTSDIRDELDGRIEVAVVECAIIDSPKP